MASASSEERLHIEEWWLTASPTRRTSESSSIFVRMVSFACSSALVRKAILRSTSFAISLCQETVDLRPAVAELGSQIEKIIRCEAQCVKYFGSDLGAFG